MMKLSSLKKISFNQTFSKKMYGVGSSEYFIILLLLSSLSIAAFQKYGQDIQHQAAGIAGEVSGTRLNKEQHASSNRLNNSTNSQYHQRALFPARLEKAESDQQSMSRIATQRQSQDLSLSARASDDQEIQNFNSKSKENRSASAVEPQPILQRIIADLDLFKDGLIEGVQSQGQGLLDMILHPIDTAKALYSLVNMLIDDPAAVAQALLDEFSGHLDSIKKGDVVVLGYFIGENISPAAILSVVKKSVAITGVVKKVNTKDLEVKNKNEEGTYLEQEISTVSDPADQARHAESTAAIVQVTKSVGDKVDELSLAASVADRGGLTAAGRALQKHGGREGSVFPPAKGNPASINKQGQDIVDDILTSPGATMTTRNHARYGNVTEVRASDGRGVRYDTNAKFMGLLEP